MNNHERTTIETAVTVLDNHIAENPTAKTKLPELRAMLKNLLKVSNSGPTAFTTLVNNNIDQVIRYYRDDNGDGDTADASEYDYSGHLVVKLFNDGRYLLTLRD